MPDNHLTEPSRFIYSKNGTNIILLDTYRIILVLILHLIIFSPLSPAGRRNPEKNP